jgi:hypothetical protein
LDFTENKSQKEIGVTESWQLPEFWTGKAGTYRKMFFFMLSWLIFNSNVDRGIPSIFSRTI